MDSFGLVELLRSSEKRMRLDLRERLVGHPGELGTGREEIIRQFLRSYLPKRFEVSTGFTFDSKGNVSKQLDIIIADGSACPRFETAGGNRFYPCESVVAVGQVRSSLTSLGELRESLENLESVKSLDRSAGGHAVDKDFGENIDHRVNHLHQVFTFLFVTGAALAKETLHEELMRYILERPAHLWPNVVVALDRYLVTYCCDDGICPNPMHARGVALQSQSEEGEVLMRFYLLLGKAIEVTRVSGLPYWEYLHNARSWDANVFFSCVGDPPPYLSTISGS
jgi:hypothetical protein